MFKRTKRKIVFTVVFSLIALMAVTLTTIYVSNRIMIRRESDEMLSIYAERFTLPGQQDGHEECGEDDFSAADRDMPPEPPGGRYGGREPAFRLSTFYSVAYSKTGEVLAINSGNGELRSEEEIEGIASSIIKKGGEKGSVGTMTYLVVGREEYTLVAMIDGTLNDNNQKMLFREMIVIGLISTAILLVLAVFIARRIVRPLEENDLKQKRFVSDAGHELKTPIAVISANSALLKRQIGDNEWLSNIDYENGRMKDLVKQLLMLSRAEGADIAKETLDLSELVAGETLPFESLAFEKGKRIISDIESGIYVQGNAGQLRQLVSILLDNALSYGTGEEIKISIKRERHNAALSVVNGSKEMNADTLAHLFDRFYRTDEARSEKDAHYGLGLSIAKAIASAHGGNIRAEYREGEVVFSASIPIKKA